jgi:hypothetical protein
MTMSVNVPYRAVREVLRAGRGWIGAVSVAASSSSLWTKQP